MRAATTVTKYFSQDLTILGEAVILKLMLKYLNIDSSFRALAEPTRRAIVERLSQIEPGGLAPLADWVAERRSLMERRLDRLGELLAETEPSTQEPQYKTREE